MRPVNVGRAARHEEARSVQTIVPPLGVGRLSARNRALALPAGESNFEASPTECRLNGALQKNRGRVLHEICPVLLAKFGQSLGRESRRVPANLFESGGPQA